MPNFSAVLRDLNGSELTDAVPQAESPPKIVPLTLGRVSANALIQQYPDELNLAGADKVKRFALAMKVVDGAEVTLSGDEIDAIKERIAKAYGPLVVGRAFQLLDPTALEA